MLCTLNRQEDTDMKLEITLKNGKCVTIDNVESYREENPKYGLAQTTTMVNITLKHGGTTIYEVAQKPTEGMIFEVKPLEIDRSKFEKPRSDQQQEWTRQIIQAAFAEVDNHPEKYASDFYTLIPYKNWDGYKTVVELKEYVNDLGGEIAYWVEQALEWAQRIFNGEGWEEVCNNADTANWHRMVIWNGYLLFVGGSRKRNDNSPPSYVLHIGGRSGTREYYNVPLVRFKKK